MLDSALPTSLCPLIDLLRFARSLQVAVAAAAMFAISVAAQSPLPGLNHTSSGVEFSTATLTLRVDALRPDVIRVRMFPKDRPAEDASWAVLPDARTARVAVTSEAAGFSTTALRITGSADLR